MKILFLMFGATYILTFFYVVVIPWLASPPKKERP